jgi:hypothetical protein
MNIDDATLVHHLDALLRDFVRENRALFWFWRDLPTESALSEAGWRYRVQPLPPMMYRRCFRGRLFGAAGQGRVVAAGAGRRAHPAAYPPQIEGRPGQSKRAPL